MRSWLGKIGKLPQGVAMAVAGIAVLTATDWFVISSITLLAVAAGAWELGSLLGRSLIRKLLLVVSVVCAGPLCLWLLQGKREAYVEFFSFVLAFWVAVVPLWMIFKLKVPSTVLAATGSLVLVGAWVSITLLAEFDRLLLILGLIAVWLIDTAGWFFGKNYGKHLLAPTISPNKTWEGLLGGLFAMYIFATVCWFFTGATQPHWLAMVLGACLCALAVLGDLSESLLKRNSDVKDSGVLLGAHGGVLDRIDSWLPVLPFIGLLSSLLVEFQ